ncbi:hypothetical protein [Aliivibrio sp. S10_S31]|uniref:YaaC family protein n=1 Tax=Aliivibrio sp. S10_S31 TaxID=2720224 RepID=UPI0016817D0B|nr:hypothetical protein [Aliivibrio sp. S10_S31]MBD1571577.1 hypothetical protein [Aliivibrio sp. S10_S31]
MNGKVWQELLVLESRDAVERLYSQIHGRKLAANRIIAINNAAKQSREYFRNAFESNYFVRPLLTFYGVASLSRALILLLKLKGGEETLTAGHGLSTDDWRKVFSGELHQSLSALLDLRVSLCKGLFVDLIDATENKSCIHVRSSSVDWAINYEKPPMGYVLTFGEILKRLPDLANELKIADHSPLSIYVNEMTYNSGDGLKVNAIIPDVLKNQFESINYSIESDNTLRAPETIFTKNTALFSHSYLNKQFGSIPRLSISCPLNNNGQFSELAMLYITSYYMSMLVRYFPTYWVSLVQGGKGDILWPAIYKAQQVVETTYPELVMELIKHVSKPKT